MSEREETHDKIAFLQGEIADVDRQLAEGDLDVETAERLKVRYRTEIEQIGPDGTPEGLVNAPEQDLRRRVSMRTLIGSAVVGLAIIGLGVFAVLSLESGSSGAEGVASDVLGGGDVDLSEITNEQMEAVVADNPDVVGMRLALARRYFEEGSFDKALDHYFEVLERERNPEALANIGWMTHLSGRPDVALGYLEAALQRDPRYLPATWFLANVYVELDRIDDAVPLVEEISGRDDVPETIREQAALLLDQITTP